jgi:hypothetical protein
MRSRQRLEPNFAPFQDFRDKDFFAHRDKSVLTFFDTQPINTGLAPRACYPKQNMKKKKSTTTETGSPEFAKLLAASVAKFEGKQDSAAKKWGIGTFERWELDQNLGILRFVNVDGSGLEADPQVIGSFDPINSSWEWAWNNPYVAGPLKSDVLKVKAYGETHQFPSLITGKFIANESIANGMAAIALKVGGGDSVFEGRAADIVLMIAFRNVRKVAKRVRQITRKAA